MNRPKGAQEEAQEGAALIQAALDKANEGAALIQAALDKAQEARDMNAINIRLKLVGICLQVAMTIGLTAVILNVIKKQDPSIDSGQMELVVREGATAPITLTGEQLRELTTDQAEDYCRKTINGNSPSYGVGLAIDRKVEAAKQADDLAECLSHLRAAIYKARAETPKNG